MFNTFTKFKLAILKLLDIDIGIKESDRRRSGSYLIILRMRFNPLDFILDDNPGN